MPENMADQKLFSTFYAGLRRANFSSEQETNYFNDMTTQRDINNQIKFAQDKGHAEGLAEGEQNGRRDERIKMAKALKEQGVSAEVIANASGLSIEEIEKL